MKIWTIIKKEYRLIVKKKSFIFSTLLTPVMMGAFMFLPLLLSKVGRQEKTIVIEDYSGIVHAQFQSKSDALPEVKETLKLKFTASATVSPQQNLLVKEYEQKLAAKEDVQLELTDAYREQILGKKIDGLILIPEDVKQTRRIYFCALNIADFGTNKYITSTVQRVLSEKILIDQAIDINIVEEAIRDVALETVKVKKEGTSKSSSGMEYMMSIFMITILLMVIMLYGQLMMRGVLEEKTNRIVEVLISSARTETLFYGKIIGIGLAGLTQVGLWVLLAIAFLGAGAMSIDTNIVNFLSLELGIYFVIFFIIGYFMYSIMFAIVGASVNTDQEAQQYAAPITYLLLVPFFIGIMVTQNPNTPLVIITSLVPVFTPVLMFMRISVAVPSFLQILLSIVVSLLFTVFLAWFGARVFRVGILMYGKKPSPKELIRWIRYK